MNELKLFKGHEVRIVLDKEGKVYFHGQDVATVLEIVNVRESIKNYSSKHKALLNNSDVSNAYFRNFNEPLNNRGELFLTEAGIYKLAFRSPKKEAEDFTDWVTEDVLPAIRKEGAYITDKADPEKLRKKADEIDKLQVAFNSANMFNQLIEESDLSPNIKLLTAKTIYEKVGIELPFNIKAEKQFYDTTQIAKRLGIMAKSGKPATTAVSQLIKQMDISEDEREEFFEGKGKWQGTVYKYAESVIKRVEDWLKDNNYPSIIQGNKRNYHVQYALEVA